MLILSLVFNLGHTNAPPCTKESDPLDNQLILLIIFLHVIQIYTKFARLYFLQFTTFHNQTSQF